MWSAGVGRSAGALAIVLVIASLASLVAYTGRGVLMEVRLFNAARKPREQSPRLNHTLPTPTEPDPHGVRVLAVITGAWTRPYYNSTMRRNFLHQMLERYVHACEVGYDVQVVLSTHKGWDYNGWLELQHYFCSRTMSNLPVRVVEHEVQPLTEEVAKMSGTVVDNLAFKPRLIFTEERDNFDLFISTEDDIGIEAHHISYFLKWAKFFEGTNFYPSFGFFEVPMGYWFGPPKDALEQTVTAAHVMLNVRFSVFDLYRYRGIDFFSMHGYNPGCCMYMLTKAMLLEEMNRSDWLDAWRTYVGEFNAHFNGRNWLGAHRRMVFPVEDLHRSIFNHLPHNYVWKNRETFVPFEALLTALHGCTNATLNHERERLQPGIKRTQIVDPKYNGTSEGWATMCRNCLQNGGAVDIRIAAEQQPEQTGPRQATHECIARNKVRWIFYPKRGLED